MFDPVVIETGNGGDLQLVGNDLGVVFKIENMIYLALFGGNKEAVTKNKSVEVESLDFWGNSLFMPNNPSQQFNSITEKTLDKIALNSEGRILVENAIKKDLEFLSDFNVNYTLSATVQSDDRLKIEIRLELDSKNTPLIIINFKKSTDGDFFILDFNDDFLV